MNLKWSCTQSRERGHSGAFKMIRFRFCFFNVGECSKWKAVRFSVVASSDALKHQLRATGISLLLCLCSWFTNDCKRNKRLLNSDTRQQNHCWVKATSVLTQGPFKAYYSFILSILSWGRYPQNTQTEAQNSAFPPPCSWKGERLKMLYNIWHNKPHDVHYNMEEKPTRIYSSWD